MPRRLIELRVYPDTWVLSPSFPERIVYLSYPFNEGMQAVLVAQSRAFYPVVAANTRSYTLKDTTDVFRMPVNIWPEEALAFKAIPRDYKQTSGYCRVLIEVEEDLQTDPTAIIEELQEQLTDQAAAIATLESDTSAQDGAIAALATDVAALQQADTAQAGAISAILTKNTSQDGAIAALQSTATAQATLITNLQATVNTFTAQLNWQSMSLLNGWQNFGAPFSNASFARHNNFVYLRGVIKGDTATNSIIATLPVGYRPAIRRLLDAVAGGSGFVATASRFDVVENGTIQFFSSYPSFLSFDGAFFYVGDV